MSPFHCRKMERKKKKIFGINAPKIQHKQNIYNGKLVKNIYNCTNRDSVTVVYFSLTQCL